MTDYTAIAQGFVSQFDNNGDGSLDFGEFTQLYNQIKSTRNDLGLDELTAEALF